MNTVEVNEKDYSEIVKLIKIDDQRNLNHQIEDLIEHVTLSLKKRVSGYTYKEIKEIVISEYYTLHQRIINEKINSNKAILSYYYRTCLHKIYHYTEMEKRYVHLNDDEHFFREFFVEPHEIEDGYEYLYHCINKLRKEYQDIINLYLKYPSIQSKDAGKKLGMSDGAVRLYKYRALKELKQYLSKDYINLPTDTTIINDHEYMTKDKKEKEEKTLVNVISDLNTLKDNYKRGNINEEAYKLKLKLLEDEVNVHIDEMSELQIG